MATCVSGVRWSTALVAAVLGSPVAWTAPSSKELLEIVQITATRRPERSFDISPSVTVIPAADLAGRVPRTVSDYFKGEPGTYVQQTTPGQGLTIIRGLKGSEVLHLIDGFRLNNAIFRNAPNQYIALVDAWNLERVEAVRGPLATLHGGDAMGGVVQFITRSPSFLSESVERRGKVAAQAATADSSTSMQLEGELGNRLWSVHGGLSWQDVGRLRVGGGDRLPFTAFRSVGAYGKLRIDTEWAGSFIAQAQLTEQPETARYDALVPGFGQTRPDSAELLFKPQRRHFAQIRWLREWGGGVADSMDLQIGYQRITDDRTSRDFGSVERNFERNLSTLVGGTAQFLKHLPWQHEITYGVELYHDEVESSRKRAYLPFEDTSVAASRFPDGSQMGWIGMYGSDEWQIDDRLAATLGVRVTRYRIGLAPTAAAPGVRLEPNDISGNLGVRFKVSDTVHLVSNLGRGFRPPNIFDLGTFGPRGNRFSIPNPDLQPESVVTVDVGAKYAFHRLSGELSVFRSRYHDRITQVLTGQTDARGRFIVQSRNATRLELEGLEAGTRWLIRPTLSMRATATWTRGEEKFGGEVYPADRIPPLFGMLSVRYAPRPMWSLEGWLNWAGRQDALSPRDLVDPRINPAGTAGWSTANLRLSLDPSPSVRLGVGVENLTDRRYRDHGSGFDAPGRSAFITGEWRFGR